MRACLYRILEGGRPATLPMRIAETFLIVLISLNVIAAIVETVDLLHVQFATWFEWFEIASIAVFSVEYLARVWVSVEDPRAGGRGPARTRLRYLVSPLALIDLAAIAPAFLGLLIAVDLRWLRLFRLLRIFKLTRYWSALGLLYRVLREEAQIVSAALSLLCVVIVVASGLMYAVEHRAQPEAFASIPSTMWWTVVTLTTVGYGDVIPVTAWGKALGGLISLIGIGAVAFPAGILAAGFINQIRNEGDRAGGTEDPLTDGTGALPGETRQQADPVSGVVPGDRRAAGTSCPHCGGPLPPPSS